MPQGRKPTFVSCPRCGETVTLTHARFGHEGCIRGPQSRMVPCRYCGVTVTRTEWHTGHEGCTRIKRRYSLGSPKQWRPRVALADAARELEQWKATVDPAIIDEGLNALLVALLKPGAKWVYDSKPVVPAPLGTALTQKQ